MVISDHFLKMLCSTNANSAERLANNWHNQHSLHRATLTCWLYFLPQASESRMVHKRISAWETLHCGTGMYQNGFDAHSSLHLATFWSYSLKTFFFYFVRMVLQRRFLLTVIKSKKKKKKDKYSCQFLLSISIFN